MHTNLVAWSARKMLKQMEPIEGVQVKKLLARGLIVVKGRPLTIARRYECTIKGTH